MKRLLNKIFHRHDWQLVARGTCRRGCRNPITGYDTGIQTMVWTIEKCHECGKERAYIHDCNGYKHRQSVDFIRCKIALGITV